MLQTAAAHQKSRWNSLPIGAWTVALLVSILPDILFREITGSLPGWLFGAKLALLGSLLLGSLFWEKLHPLRLFFAVLLSVILLEHWVFRAYEMLAYKTWFAGASPFVREMLAVQAPRATAAAALTVIMLVLVRSFKGFFLVPGKLDAPAQPIPFILTRPPAWHVLGPAITAAMCLGLLVFVFAFGNPPSLQSLTRVLPLLPLVLLFAASNAFGEEMLYRAPWLAALEGPLGPVQALLLTAVYFGISHFYGVPYGVLGVIMSFIPGWLMGKAMLETRGFFWAWFIHLWMDFVIFLFIALSSITPGGS